MCSKKNLNKNILVYDISYKTLIGGKPVQIWFDRVNCQSYNRTGYLILFGAEKDDAK